MPFCTISLPTLPVPTTKGIIGKPSSEPNFNLFNNCLRASSAPFSLCSLSNPVGKKSKKSQSPNVPISSTSETINPVPIPPPTAMATNLSVPVILFNLLASLTALAAFTLLVVLTYLPVLIPLTNCLTFWDVFATTGMAVFCNTLPAPYNWPMASVILPAAVSAATSSDAFSILPNVVRSKASLSLPVKVSSTGIPSSWKMSYSSVPNVTSPFGIFIPALIPAPVNDSIRDASSSTSLPCTLSIILLIPLSCSST